jgi:predicted O-methyltransferase YrrM
MTRQLIVCPVCNGASNIIRPNPGLALLSIYQVLKEVVGSIQPRSYLEIGVREGDSLSCVLQADVQKRIERVVLCDNWGSTFGGTNRQTHIHIMDVLLQTRYAKSIEFYDGDSKETVPRIWGPFDLILLDGDHSYDGCMADMENCFFLFDTGRMVIDDVMNPAHPDLMTCINDFIRAHESIEIERIATAPNGVAILKAKGE